MDRAFYSATIAEFCSASPDQVLDSLKAQASQQGYPPQATQIAAWELEISCLRNVLGSWTGSVYFEYTIPRMGRRIDVVALVGPVIFVLEFKGGSYRFESSALDQVWDYALDLKNFHETSHGPIVAPLLVVEKAPLVQLPLFTPSEDGLLQPIRTNLTGLRKAMEMVLQQASPPEIDPKQWEAGRYRPTPTIIEAAAALYGGHSVTEISRHDAGVRNLNETSTYIEEIIRSAREHQQKAICFVTGVPGSGKTLVGLNAATKHRQTSDALFSVFLSGNGPLVSVLREALVRDQVRREAERGHTIRLKEARSRVEAFIQNVHHFRDEYLLDKTAPVEHVAIFDEAQRAWNHSQTVHFMQRRKHVSDFDKSEPDYLISCMDRHQDWAVIVCLVGGGQEINTGEAGIGEWITSLNKSYPHWQVHISPQLLGRDYSAGGTLAALEARPGVVKTPDLHLGTSLRSYRAENVSTLVQQLLDLDSASARASLLAARKYPIVLTRKLSTAKTWLKDRARASERYGIVVSSQAKRLRPYAIDVKSPMDPVHWFLDPKKDVRSSYYLEDVATEFQVQGLELDWTCLAWDADLRYVRDGWEHWSFRGDKWQRIGDTNRQRYQENAYRVLLTRARQGMVILVPEGDTADPTRVPSFYDPTFEYLKGVGFPVI
jgi:hypothetical protein